MNRLSLFSLFVITSCTNFPLIDKFSNCSFPSNNPYPGGMINYTLEDNEIDQKKNLKAVLLLSDGDWNLGSSPISAATRYRDKEIPIYSIVTGQDQPIADLSMEDISAPAYGLFGEQISIPYTIQSHLPRDVSTEIRLMNGKELLASKKISLPAKNRFRDSIMWYPSEIGEFDLRLEFPVEQDEELKDNNLSYLEAFGRRIIFSFLIL